MGGIIGRLTSGFAEGRYIIRKSSRSVSVKTTTFRCFTATWRESPLMCPYDRTGLCMDLITIMTDTEVMKRVSVKDGAPQYLMFPRISFYDDMQKVYPMYAKLKTIAENDNNKLFRAYGSFMEETYGE